MSRILIVGGGIVGLSVARAARLRGLKAVVLERAATIPNPDGASYDRHRMIRLHYGAAAGYSRMVLEAYPAWERLWADLGATHYADCGGIAISLAPGDYADLSLQSFRQLGIPHERLDQPAVEALCPYLTLPEQAWGLIAFPGGPLFADRILEDLAAWLRTAGAELRPGAEVVALDYEAAAVTLANGERLSGDRLVVAAGAWLPALDPERYGALPTYRQALCYVEPPAAYAAAWREAPAIVTIGDSGVYSLPDRQGAGLKFGYGPHRRPARPEEGFAIAEGESEAVLGALRPYLRDAALYRPLRMKAGYYVMDETRRFHLEARGRGLVVTSCDGQMFKFGPLVGEKVLAHLAGEIDAATLSRWAAGEEQGDA